MVRRTGDGIDANAGLRSCGELDSRHDGVSRLGGPCVRDVLHCQATGLVGEATADLWTEGEGTLNPRGCETPPGLICEFDHERLPGDRLPRGISNGDHDVLHRTGRDRRLRHGELKTSSDAAGLPDRLNPPVLDRHRGQQPHPVNLDVRIYVARRINAKGREHAAPAGVFLQINADALPARAPHRKVEMKEAVARPRATVDLPLGPVHALAHLHLQHRELVQVNGNLLIGGVHLAPHVAPDEPRILVNIHAEDAVFDLLVE